MVITLTGVNDFARTSDLKRRMDMFIGEHGDMALERLDGEEASVERIQEALQSMPFLASRKLVVLTAPGLNKRFAEQFEKLLPTIPENTDVIIVEPKPDKHSSYYKQLKKYTDFQEFNELKEPELASWLAGSAKEQGGALSLSDARYLIERVGADQKMLGSELDKLMMYDPKITRQTIDLLCDPTPQSSVFELLDAAFAGNLKRTLGLYAEQRQQKVEPQAILAMLAWQLHILAIVKTAGPGRSHQDIAAQAKVNPFVVRKSLGIAQKTTLADLKDLIHRTLVLDVRLKSQSIDADEAVCALLVTIAD